MTEIRTILGASTGNISYTDKICLEEDPGHYCAYPKIDYDADEEHYGWLMNITHYKYDEAYLSDIKEVSIRTLIEKGLELGVDWIDIDRDAEPVDDLPTYEW